MPSFDMGSALSVAAGLFARSLRRRAGRDLAADLRHGLRRGELALHYQPQVDLRSGRPVGAEALLRWQHPREGAVPPDTFIPLAERSSLIVELGGWVLRRAAAEAAAHPGLGRVAVNISARQILAGALPGQVEAALAEAGLPPERLELELTETLLLDESAEVAAMLGRLRDRGIGLAIDDFGAGYASFARLRRLPFTALKLDRSLLPEHPGAPEDAAILHAVRDLGRALGLRLVAEGVERAEQRALLAGLGFDEGQGWLFGRPVPVESPDGAGLPLALPAGTPIVPGACLPPASPSSAPASPASPAPAA